MSQHGPCTTSCVRFLGSMLLLGACSPGCLSSWVGSGSRDGPCVVQQPPHTTLSDHPYTVLPMSSSSGRAGLFDAFADQAGILAHGVTCQDEANPLLDRMAARQIEDVYALSDEGSIPEESRRASMRFARRALSEAVRQQGVYQQVRGAIREMTGDNSFTPLAASPHVDDAQRNRADGTGFPLAKEGEGDFFRALNPSEYDAHIGLGVRPSLGVSWMRFYRFSWNPSEGEMVHRVDYSVGGVGLGGVYRVVDGGTADAGVGMQFLVGRYRVSVSASRVLYDADGNQATGDQQVMAGLAWRY